VSNYNTSLTAKRLELLHQVVPRADTIAVLVNSTSPAGQTIETEARSAAQALGLRLDVLGASTEGEIDAAFAAAAQRGAGGLLVAGDAYFNSRRAQLIALAARHRIPANYDRKEIAIDGGLMSYGMNNLICIDRSASTRAKSSRVPGPPISQSSSRLRWSLS
jgi:putative ABC transport system substrate-binding protein